MRVTATYGTSSETATITVNASPVTTTGLVLSPKTGHLVVGDTQKIPVSRTSVRWEQSRPNGKYSIYGKRSIHRHDEK
ncbi:hypothetical protein OL548_20445 [Lysinibacillus sp. MHQ-1]|nr:hypothetical protein OL548_20445 [Lysinibacillus sp. MHQ-1]